MTRDYSVFVEGTLVKFKRRMSARVPAGTLGLFVPPFPLAVMSEVMVTHIRVVDNISPYIKVAMKDIEFVAPPLTLKAGDRVRVLTATGAACKEETTIIALEKRLDGSRQRAFVNINGAVYPFPLVWMMPIDISNTTFKNLLERGD